MDRLSYYIKAKKEGWKLPKYTAKIVFKDKEQFTIRLEGTETDLILYAIKCSNFSITSEWKIYKDGNPVPMDYYIEFFNKVNMLKEKLCGK